jgi:hypothetical protein
MNAQHQLSLPPLMASTNLLAICLENLGFGSSKPMGKCIFLYDQLLDG